MSLRPDYLADAPCPSVLDVFVFSEDATGVAPLRSFLDFSFLSFFESLDVLDVFAFFGTCPPQP